LELELEDVTNITPEELAKREGEQTKAAEREAKSKFINEEVKEAIKLLSEKLDMKLMITGLSNEFGTVGLWVSPNTDKWDEMAFARFIDKNI
jgi:hypothetical protein